MTEPDNTSQFYIDDLNLRDWPSLHRMARQPGFFYAYISESRQPVWLGVTRFLLLMQKLRLRRPFRPRHWFLALRTSEGTLLGCVVLLDFGILAPQVAEIAYFTAMDWRGQGLSQRAVFSVARWAQQNMGLKGLYAHVDPDNPASLAILGKLGLTPTKFVPAAQSQFTDRAGQRRPCWIMQTTPPSLQAALANLAIAEFAVLSGHKRPDADQSASR